MTAAQAELSELVARWRPAARNGTFFKKKAKKRPDDLAGAQRLATLASEANASSEDVIEALEHACRAFDQDRSIRIAYAQALADGGRIGDAIAEFEERLQSSPDDASSLLDVASLYERAGRNDLAVDRLRRAVDALVASGDVDGAIGAARRLIALEPGSLEDAADLVALLRTGDAPLLAEGLEHLADVYRERGKLGQEASACAELFSLRPERVDIRSRLSSIYTRILEVDPDDPDAWIGLAAVDENLADQLRVLLESEQTMGVAQTPAPTAADAAGGNGQRVDYALRKARELMAEGDIAGASLCLERAVKTSDNAEHRLELARCYLLLHRDDEARSQGLRALADAHVGHHESLVEAILTWSADGMPFAKDALEEALFLNHRPESADTLYEELAAICEAARTAFRGAAAPQERLA